MDVQNHNSSGLKEGHYSSTMSSAGISVWRVAGLSYNQYVAVASRALRRCMKEEAAGKKAAFGTAMKERVWTGAKAGDKSTLKFFFSFVIFFLYADNVVLQRILRISSPRARSNRQRLNNSASHSLKERRKSLSSLYREDFKYRGCGNFSCLPAEGWASLDGVNSGILFHTFA